MLRRALVWMWVATAYGCVELDDSVGEADPRHGWQGEQPSEWIELSDGDSPPSAVPDSADSMDVELCDALVGQQRRCEADFDAPAVAVDDCVSQFACSRQLWRSDAEEVYRCLRERPCDDPDPVMTCLRQVAADTEPSEAELRFAARLDASREACGELVDVAPRQADEVYEVLEACFAQHDDCADKAACAHEALRALVERVCGPAAGDSDA